MIIPLHMH